MARKKAHVEKEEQKKPFCFCCEHSLHNIIFIGIVLFAIGVMLWASEVGIVPSRFLWPVTLMVLGILFVFKAYLIKE